jgi:hypothetical protein
MVNYEADGAQLEAMLSAGMTTGLGDEWLRLGETLHGLSQFSRCGNRGSRGVGFRSRTVRTAHGHPHTVDPGKIKEIRVVRTVVGGMTSCAA